MKYRIYVKRRRRFGRQLGEGCLALIPAATQVLRNGDVHYPFRQDSDFLYLTGFDEPDALLLIVGGTNPRSMLISRGKDPIIERWNGEIIGQQRVAREFGIRETYSFQPQMGTEALIARLRMGANGGESMDAFSALTQRQAREREEVATLIGRLISEATSVAYPKDREEWLMPFLGTHEGALAKLPVINSRQALGELRIKKSKYEIAFMRNAAAVSAEAHRAILSFVQPGMHEYDVDATLACAFRRGGGDQLHAYPPIVASGANACILHYVKNDAVLKEGELLLIDAGCEIAGYASDITRTFPVSGTWSKPQLALYKVVLRAQLASIAAANVGTPLEHLHDTARWHVAEGLLELGIIKAKSVEDAIARGLDKEYMPHGTSHWLGLDVHDAGDYQLDPGRRKTRRLEAGMVITIEPGIYVRPSPFAPSQYWNIGIRIEDDILITPSGPEVLSHLAPKDPEEIEAIMHCEMA